MVDLTRNFLTAGPAGGGGGGASGDDITTGRAYRVVFREITSAIDDATNKNDSHSKEIVDQLKALRAQLKADAEKYSRTRLGDTPPEVYREFVDVLKTVKGILERDRGQAPSTTGPTPAIGVHREAHRVHHHRQGHRTDDPWHDEDRRRGLGEQAFRGGGPIGVAAMAGADAVAPGLGIVVKAIQENSNTIRDTYRVIVNLPKEIGDGYKAVRGVVKGIHDFLNPRHPLGVISHLEKMAVGGAALGLGALGLTELGVFGPEAKKKLEEMFEKGLSGLDEALGDAAKKGREELENKLNEILNPKPTKPDGTPVDTPSWPEVFKNKEWWKQGLPQLNPNLLGDSPNPPGGKVQDLNKRLDQIHGRTDSFNDRFTFGNTPAPASPVYSPKELNQLKDQWRNKRQGILGSRRPASARPGTASATQSSPAEIMLASPLSLRTPGGFTGDDQSSGGPVSSGQRLGLGYLGGPTGTLSDVVPFAKGGIVDRPTIGLLGEAGPEAVVPLSRSGFNTGFNTGGDKGDVVVGLMKKQTDLLGGILEALTGGGGRTRGLGGGGGFQLASLSTAALSSPTLSEVPGVSGARSGLLGGGAGSNPLKSAPYSLPGGRLPGGGFGPGSLGGGFGGRGGGGGGRRGGGSGRRSSSSSSPGGTPDTPPITSTTPTGPAYQGLAPPGTGPLGGLSISAFTPGGSGFSNLPTTKTIPNPQFAPGSDIRPDPGLFGPPTQTQGPFDTSKATTATTRQNQSPNIDPGMFGPPTNVGGLSSLGGGTSGNGDIGGRGSTPTNEKGTAGVAAIVAAEWRKVGMSEAGIAGVLANIKEESSFDPNLRHPDQPKFSGEAHFAHGLYQEGGDEWNNYEKWLHGRDWKDPKLQSQFAAENLKKNYPKVWEKMNKGSNTEAAEAYVRGYLKPKQQYQDSRVAGFQRRGVPNVSNYTSSKATDPIISAPGARPGGATQTPIPTTPGSSAQGSVSAAPSAGGTLIVFKGKDGQIDAKSMEQIAASRGQKVQYFEHTEAGKAAQWVKDNPGSYDVIGFSAGANHSTLKEFFDKTPRKPGQLDTAGRSDRSPAFARPPGVLGVDIKDHKTGQQQLAASSAKQIATRSLTPVNAPTGADAKIGVGTGISANQSLDFWKARNQVGARLDGVRKDELHVTAEAVRMFERDHPGLGVRILGPGGGTRAPGSDKGNHSHGNALDLMIYDKATGKLYADMPGGKNRAENLASANKVGIGESAPLYQELANNARIANEKFYPGSPIRYGGYFDQGGRGDVQHIDKTSNSAALGDWPTGYSKSQLEYLGMDPKLNKGVGSPQDIARRVAAEYPGQGQVLAGNQPTLDTPGATPAFPQRSPGDVLKDLAPGGTGDTTGPAATTTTRSLTPIPTTTERRVSHAHHKGFDDTTDPVTRSLTPTGGDTRSYAPEFKSTVLRPEFTKGTMTPYERHLDRTLRKDQAERDANDAEANRQTPLPRERPVEAKQDTLDTTDSPVDANPIGASPAKADTQDKPQHTPKHHQRHPSKTSRRVASHTHQPHNVQSHNHGKHHAIHHPGNRNRHTSSRHTNQPNHHTIHQHPTHHSRHPHHSQPHHVRHPNRGHAPMHHDDMNIGNHPTATAMREDIGRLQRLASDMHQRPEPDRGSGRQASSNMHHGTPEVSAMNSDIAAVMASGTYNV